MKYQENHKIGWRQSQVPSLSPRNKTWALMVKNCGNVTDTNILWSSPILFDFFTLFQEVL